MKISDIVQKKGRTVHTVTPGSTVTDVVDRLAETGIGALLVVDPTGAIRGIVSERDIVRKLGRYGATALRMETAAVMTRHVETCTPDETVASAMARMTAGRYRHLPVLEGHDLVGIVSIGDLVGNRVREMELETGVLRDLVIAGR